MHWAILGAFILQVLLPIVVRANVVPDSFQAGQPSWTVSNLEKQPYVFQKNRDRILLDFLTSFRRIARHEKHSLDIFSCQTQGRLLNMTRKRFTFHAVIFFYPLALLIPPPDTDPYHPLG